VPITDCLGQFWKADVVDFLRAPKVRNYSLRVSPCRDDRIRDGEYTLKTTNEILREKNWPAVGSRAALKQVGAGVARRVVVSLLPAGDEVWYGYRRATETRFFGARRNASKIGKIKRANTTIF
jgi:hypothetical protein